MPFAPPKAHEIGHGSNRHNQRKREEPRRGYLHSGALLSIAISQRDRGTARAPPPEPYILSSANTVATTSSVTKSQIDPELLGAKLDAGTEGIVPLTWSPASRERGDDA